MNLDEDFLLNLSEDNYKSIFEKLVESKTDRYTAQVKLPMGVDGINYNNIENSIEQFSRSFVKRAKSGKYIFSPFREMQIPKSPYTKNEFKVAKACGKLRTLSIGTINDTIFQNILYSSIYEFTEKKYSKDLNDVVFGYRKGKSVVSAVELIREYMLEGYKFGLDGDIEKYFDVIDHNRLISKIKKIYGKETLVTKYLIRFIKVKKVTVENKKIVTEYFNKKPITTPRVKGIPQGGVLSGLLANIYLYNFDKYVISNLSKKYDIKYIRYADDFIILCKNEDIILDIYKKVRTYLKREKLHLHDLDSSLIDGSVSTSSKKSKAINLEKVHYTEFLGFRISPKYLGIKQDNINKFKKNINHIIDLSIKNKDNLSTLIYKINAKIVGNAIFAGDLFQNCNVCSKKQKPQSWINFFVGVSDMRVLKRLDNWIRFRVRYAYSMISKKKLPKKYFLSMNKILENYVDYRYCLQSLFYTSIKIKSLYAKSSKEDFCECLSFTPINDIAIS